MSNDSGMEEIDLCEAPLQWTVESLPFFLNLSGTTSNVFEV